MSSLTHVRELSMTDSLTQVVMEHSQILVACFQNVHLIPHKPRKKPKRGRDTSHLKGLFSSNYLIICLVLITKFCTWSCMVCYRDNDEAYRCPSLRSSNMSWNNLHTCKHFLWEQQGKVFLQRKPANGSREITGC